MTRFVTCVGCIGVLMTLTLAAPVPKGIKQANDYYPLRVGDKWEYVRNENADQVWVEEVSSVETVDGARLGTVRIQPSNPNAVAYDTKYKADRIGWSFHSHGEMLYDPPSLFVKADLQAGDSWESTYRFVNTDYQVTVTVGEPERVSVPAGTFTAIPITTAYTSPAGRRPFTNWYVSGIGMIKQVANGRITQELKAFTSGK